MSLAKFINCAARNLFQLLSVVVISIALASCGGGGGNSGTADAIEDDLQDESEITDDGVGTPEDPVADNDLSDNEQSQSDETDNGQADNDVTNEGEVISDPSDAPALLFVTNGPAQGIAGGRISNFSVKTINAAGYGVVSAGISGAASGSALWAIKPDGIELIWRTGDPLTSDSGAPSFSAVIDSSVSGSGEMAFVIRTVEGGNALVTITQGQPELLLLDGDESIGPYDSVLDGPAIIESILAVRRSNTDLYVLAEFEENRNDEVWLQQTVGGFEQVIRSSTNFIVSSTALSVALASDPECRLYIRAAQQPRGGAFAAIDDGSVVANARRLCGRDSGNADDVIARRDISGSWVVVGAVDEGVPEAPASTFQTIAWQSVDKATGDAIVAARVQTVDGTSRGQVDVGWWSYAASGVVKLLLLEGEEIQVGTEVVNVPSTQGNSRTSPVVRVRDGRAVIWFGNAVDRNVQTIVAGGIPHTSAQPHSSLAVPGASSLTTLVATGLPGPMGQEVQSSFSSISLPVPAADGSVWFTGTLDNATIGGQSRTALWKADSNGEILPELSIGAAVTVSGVETSIVAFDGFVSGGVGLEPGFVTDAGDIYLLVFIGGSFSGSAALLKMQVNSGI